MASLLADERSRTSTALQELTGVPARNPVHGPTWLLGRSFKTTCWTSVWQLQALLEDTGLAAVVLWTAPRLTHQEPPPGDPLPTATVR
ncbi:Desmocollin-2 [Manis pentadactyla]|nr:Desmocollin-2 [Manis pentadactyla]